MSFQIIKGSDDVYHVSLSEEPSWVLGMRSRSLEIEPALDHGAWLVVAFSVWSAPDREEAYKAIELAKCHNINVRIGLLPYDYPEEIELWLPQGNQLPGVSISDATTDRVNTEVHIAQTEHTSPVWFALVDRKPFAVRQGPLQSKELTDFLLAIEREGKAA